MGYRPNTCNLNLNVWKKMKQLLFVIVSLFTLGGCVSHGLSDAEKASIIAKYILSENLDHRSPITTFSLDSWTSLSDQYLVIHTSPFKPYLIQLATRCQDLDYGPTLVVNSRIPNNLSEGFDSVYSPENQTFKYYISRIYPLTKDQNKALIAEVNPAHQDKLIEKPTTDNKD